MKISYVMADPTGNITALVTSPVEKADYGAVCDAIFARYPACEQIGFVSENAGTSQRLDMAGGEFCGNATLCAAALLARAENPSCTEFTASLSMPCPVPDSYDGFPLMHLPGISHLIVSADRFPPALAEAKIREIAEELKVEALGILLWEEPTCTMRPLVYVPGAGTLVWEHGCASGSTAVGYYRYLQDPANRITPVHQPGGTITMEVRENDLLLTGQVKLSEERSDITLSRK